ncbi:MAG: diaminopimelate epimerase [Acidobacteriota bacterium]|nr:diaminopimelate epimerase [Acidobacteriota bacterium]
MKIPFVKLHGAGNDFLLTDTASAPSTDLDSIAIAICNRYTGVGGDGWMLVDRTGGPNYHASIRLFNSDGSEPELSGNGTRCAAALLAREKPDQREFNIRTGAGIKHLRLIAGDGHSFEFEMNMGQIRVTELQATVQGRDAVVVDCGNPQCALPVDSFDFDWRALGALIERDSRFPKRTNVSFLRRIDPHTLDVRFWERGAGETNSSGTGSTGAAMAAIARGIVVSPVTIRTAAGPLLLRTENGVYLTGPAEFVADGMFSYVKMAS